MDILNPLTRWYTMDYLLWYSHVLSLVLAIHSARMFKTPITRTRFGYRAWKPHKSTELNRFKLLQLLVPDQTLFPDAITKSSSVKILILKVIHVGPYQISRTNQRVVPKVCCDFSVSASHWTLEESLVLTSSRSSSKHQNPHADKRVYTQIL